MFSRRVCLFALFLSFVASSIVFAQVSRTFVSGIGVDTNPCSRTQPCRTFSAAVAAVGAGGEVYVLDSAGFGPFTINKSLTIVVPRGVVAGISVPPGGNGIDVAASDADTVVIRGIHIVGSGTQGGIRISRVGTLIVEDFNIQGFNGTNGAGIYMAPKAGATAKLIFRNGTLTSNTTAVTIDSSPYEWTMNVAAEGLAMSRNNTGFRCGIYVICTVRNSSAVQNEFTGFYSSGGKMLLDNVIAAEGLYGVIANYSGINWVTNSTFFHITGEAVTFGNANYNHSLGSNRFADNNSDGLFASTTPPK